MYQQDSNKNFLFIQYINFIFTIHYKVNTIKLTVNDCNDRIDYYSNICG